MTRSGLGAVVLLTAFLCGTADARHRSPSSAPSDAATSSPANPIRIYRDSGWIIRETKNFRICSRCDADVLSTLPERCEALRSRLQSTWLEGRPPKDWSPRCEIVVHGSLSAYCRALGFENRSVGCTTIKVDAGRVTSRRVDLRLDAPDWAEAALPHELTHVVLADRFAGRPLPAWADEGMSMLAESESKQAQRRHALRLARARGKVPGIRQLWSFDQPSPAVTADAFYGLSMEVTQFLVERDSPQRFLEFVETAMSQGHERALRDCYRIAGVSALESDCRRGLAHVKRNPDVQDTLARRDRRN